MVWAAVPRASADLPPSLDATILLGRSLVVVGALLGSVLFVLPLEGPRWPRLALALLFAAWGWLAWKRAEAGWHKAPVFLAVGLTGTGWVYYVMAPSFGVQVTGVSLLLPILACLSVLGPTGVAVVGLGGIGLDLAMRSFYPATLVPPPIQVFSLLLATALGWVVAFLHQRYVVQVADAHAAASEAAIRQRLVEHQADFLRRFINAASHEIATPLTPIMLSLAKGEPSPAGLQRIRRNADRLQHIAGGLREVAEIEARPPDRLHRLALRPAVAKAMRAHGVQWSMEGDGEAWANEDLVHMIIGEFVDNQLRHAPDTDVTLRLDEGRMVARQTPAGLEPGTVLGAPFARHHDTSRGGLGLYGLVRRLERNGGSVEMRAEAGGLVQEVRFPDRPPQQV